MHPIIADGGELTILRSLGAFAYGRWQVSWPESVPEEQRPKLADDREFGYAARLKAEPGRMGRRFVRQDVSITAADGDLVGFSDVEATLDAAAARTDGDAFFERDLTREHLGVLVPRVDFDVDDLVPVMIWGKVITAPVTRIEDVTQAGAVVDWSVHVGGQLLQDSDALERSNKQLERDIAQERRERAKEVGKAHAVASAAQSTASTARQEVAGVDAKVEAVSAVVERDRRDVATRISSLVSQADFDTYSGDLHRRLWSDQGEFNRITQEFQEKQNLINEGRAEFERHQALIDAAQEEVIGQIKSVQQDLVKSTQGQVNTVMASRFGSSHPDYPVTQASAELWECLVPTANSMQLQEWFTYDFNEGGDPRKTLTPLAQFFTPGIADKTRLQIKPNEMVRVTWAASPIVQLDSSKESGGHDPAKGQWETISAHTVTVRKPGRMFAGYWRVLWSAADRGSGYAVRIITSGGKTLASYESYSFGPLGPWGNGRIAMSVTCSGKDIPAGEQVFFQVKSSALYESQRRVHGCTSKATWIEEVG
ncbi:hypothetical protein [Corynebacterium lizhenjunii]|uniref:hypothetical protein n=1 Tax=Corynebacterium lizhenjunii TaxID=2709394 RepID=UPI0013EC5B2E|nr:hypothetical protein [Corynebacterium lizhenjunii]